jgi:Acyclic terpene utilisation family protein AtuA
MEEIRFVAATIIGAGIPANSLVEAMALRPHFIAGDAGTTDAGPFSLGSGQPAFAREAVKADLALVIRSGREAGIPVIVGSVGTAGSDAQVDWALDIVREIVEEHGLLLRVAVVKAEQDVDYLVAMLAEGRLVALEPAPPLDADAIRRTVHVVGMMGVEPIQDALTMGADLVLAGRASDSALFAAIPIMRGFPPGLAWHAGKIVECGTVACETLGKGVIFGTIRDDHFVVRPIGPGLRCTPQSVAAHSLYENADPYLFPESSGTLDLTDAVYETDDDVSVRVSGSRFRPSKYSVKLEGAELAGYSTVMFGGIRDPYILGQLDHWLSEVRKSTEQSVSDVLGLSPETYQIAIHVYGRDAVMGELEPNREAIPTEVGVAFEVLANTQDLATKIAMLARQPLLHQPIPEWSGGITTIAYLHNPPQLERGAVYRFNMHHVVLPRTQQEMFRTELVEIRARSAAEVRAGGA